MRAVVNITSSGEVDYAANEEGSSYDEASSVIGPATLETFSEAAPHHRLSRVRTRRRQLTASRDFHTRGAASGRGQLLTDCVADWRDRLRDRLRRRLGARRRRARIATIRD